MQAKRIKNSLFNTLDNFYCSYFGDLENS